LDLEDRRDQHVREAYVQTAYAAQGKTADRVMVHAESTRGNLVDQASIYVAVSRLEARPTIYTASIGQPWSGGFPSVGRSGQTALEAGLRGAAVGQCRSCIKVLFPAIYFVRSDS